MSSTLQDAKARAKDEYVHLRARAQKQYGIASRSARREYAKYKPRAKSHLDNLNLRGRHLFERGQLEAKSLLQRIRSAR